MLLTATPAQAHQGSVSLLDVLPAPATLMGSASAAVLAVPPVAQGSALLASRDTPLKEVGVRPAVILALLATHALPPRVRTVTLVRT